MRMGPGLVALGLAACSSPDPLAPQTHAFGPITVEPNSEDTSKCVTITLHNEEPLYINQVELTTGPGFHHSNWLFVPEHSFAGPDGVWTCEDRSYDQVAAGLLGGVFFAQSTQTPHEIQQFPDGVALKVPPKSKLVANIHLLNAGDEALTLQPTMGFTPIAEADAKTLMRSLDFEYHTLALPPRRQSRFSVDCDIAERHQQAFGRAPDFKIYYALAHYHEWGTGLTLEALRADGTAATIFSTTTAVGDTLGGTIDPPFDMTGFAKLRLSCDYYNDTDRVIHYGNGTGEMCIFNAFSDSPHTWAGGALDNGDPGTPVDDGGVMHFSRKCQVYSVDGER